MSPLDEQIPPAGEEIHLPGNSAQPVLVALGVTIALIGITVSVWVVVLGALLTVWQTAKWIGETRRDIDELPLHEQH